MRKVFDQASSTYDGVGVEFFRPIARGLVAELAPQWGERGVDVGCGRGAVLFPLAEAVGPRGHVTGIDLSPRMMSAPNDALAARLIAPDRHVWRSQPPGRGRVQR
jgi:O-methyltransferase/aklanonic acid methyltransferase